MSAEIFMPRRRNSFGSLIAALSLPFATCLWPWGALPSLLLFRAALLGRLKIHENIQRNACGGIGIESSEKNYEWSGAGPCCELCACIFKEFPVSALGHDLGGPQMGDATNGRRSLTNIATICCRLKEKRFESKFSFSAFLASASMKK